MYIYTHTGTDFYDTNAGGDHVCLCIYVYIYVYIHTYTHTHIGTDFYDTTAGGDAGSKVVRILVLTCSLIYIYRFGFL